MTIPITQVKTEETLDELRGRTALASKFAWYMVSGITSMVYREKGEAALNEIWRQLLSSEQKERFLAALDKLEIAGNPPAVTAALYHYFSNAIGGLNMQVIVESPKKAWIRYMAPWGSYPGMAALTVPPSVRRTILSTWHPRNGEFLNCPRLGWVATKFVAEGHPYDEGFFFEYDHDLRPEERFRVEHVEHSPEFIPEKAPKLNPQTWPESRILKGGYNYSVDYVRHVIAIVYSLFGAYESCNIITKAMRLLGSQFTGELANATGHKGTDPKGIADMFGAIFAAFRNPVEISAEGDSATLTLGGLLPFTGEADPELRAGVFNFFTMAVRQRNGHLSITRSFDEETLSERWIIKDEGEWLW
ncbi:hypothetical protein NKH72_28330 [Mesorhizobium sp. M0955]|uniref:hypothetical protein n=1 Tax=Mesorhizobium sp. M0955 TaxID=2957033 RepID=UPI003336131D